MSSKPLPHVRKPSPLASSPIVKAVSGTPSPSLGGALAPAEDAVIIGDYAITGELGSGSFATVYKGRRLKDNEPVAIKCIAVDRLDDANRKALAAEVKSLSEVHHPNIVKFLDMFRSPKYFFIVLEHCVGGDVRQYVRSHGPLAEAQAQRVLRQLAAALRHLWQIHMIHRDIKPGNLLLTGLHIDSATVKLGDFGMARKLASEDSLAQTVCGSPLYMSPELLREHKCDAKGDLWSVGVLLVELMTGRTPFTGSSPLHLLTNIEKSVWANAVNKPSAADFATHPFESMMGGIMDPVYASALSVDCKDLIWRLLRRNPVHRIGYEEFFSHPWISLHAEVVEEDDSSFESPTSMSHSDGFQATSRSLSRQGGGFQPTMPRTGAHVDITSKAISRGLSLVASIHQGKDEAPLTDSMRGARLHASTSTKPEDNRAVVTPHDLHEVEASDDFIVVDDAALSVLDSAVESGRLDEAVVHNDFVRKYGSVHEAVVDAARACVEAGMLVNQAKYATENCIHPSLDAQLRIICSPQAASVAIEPTAAVEDEDALPFADPGLPTSTFSGATREGTSLSVEDYDRTLHEVAAADIAVALDLWERSGLAFRGAVATCELVARQMKSLRTLPSMPAPPSADTLKTWATWCMACSEVSDNVADALRSGVPRSQLTLQLATLQSFPA